MNSELLELASQWLEWDRNPEDRAEIQRLVDANDAAELECRLGSRLQFGTAGLRAQMGAGYSRMCDLVIVQTAQGLLQYLQQQRPDLCSSGVVVGYDARHRSTRFAEITATVFLSASVPVYLFSSVCPTPYVAFAVRHYSAACGVMVTASHNPKQDNGYKVYWSNGSQILSPHDKSIAACILQQLPPRADSWPSSQGPQASPLCRDPLEEVSQQYNAQLARRVHFRNDITEAAMRFVYTPMHGVGQPFVRLAFEAFGLQPFISVPEQKDPDPDFPTVKFPNPEEGKSALDLSIRTAEQAGVTVILANDPDADRLAVAEKLPSGNWKVFTGNEIGALLGHWMWYKHRLLQPDSDLSHVHMMASTVSSKVLRSMAQQHGFQFHETLTGFKWMGDLSDRLAQAGDTVLFAFEEAIGFMCGTQVLDKDGVSAAVQVAEMTSHLRVGHARSLNEQLEWIWQTYGLHVSQNSYHVCHDPQLIRQIFQRIRTLNRNTYPEQVGRFRVKHVRDLTTGFDSSQPDQQAVLPVSSSSQMITFTLECGAVLTLRTSGTEPKIKHYSELIAKGLTRDQAEAELLELLAAAVEELLQPEVNKLQAQSD